MKKSFLYRRITVATLVLAVFSLLSTSCTNLVGGLGIEDYWSFDNSEAEDRELIKGTWVLKKMGSLSWNEVGNPYVKTEGITQNSHIESLHIDFEGEHMVLTFNFNRPTLVHYANFNADEESMQHVDLWKTSLTTPHGVSTVLGWENSSKVSGGDYDYDGEVFSIYDMGEKICNCDNYYFYCLFDVKNIITDEKGEIKRLILENYSPSSNRFSYEFERE